MACPYFMPTERCERELWPFRRRLPLGDGFAGCCAAPGHAGERPSDDELKEMCNLGYARGCPRMPAERVADSVRFAVACDHQHSIRVRYVLERAHLPGEHGTLEYDSAAACWTLAHADGRVQRLAESFLSTYLSRPGRADSLGHSDSGVHDS